MKSDFEYLLSTIEKFNNAGINVVCANLKSSKTGEFAPWVPRYKIVELDGHKILITGFCLNNSCVKKFGYELLEPEECFANLLEGIKEDYGRIIVLNHHWYPYSLQLKQFAGQKLNKNIDLINIIPVYTDSEYKNIQKYDTSYDPTEITVDKPIIYLYPTENTEISVKLLKSERLTCSYPKYKDEWKVLAQPNGILKDLDTNRQLYSLYYESKSSIEFKIENEGFVVKSEDIIPFLEEKLNILGLTEREAEEFIVYWLPKLEANKYNYIRFASMDEINENMPLKIDPNPDTIIRVLMTFKGLENPIDVKEQKLETPNRTGFVAVEWGGTKIK